MKQSKNSKKLGLNKVTIQDFSILGSSELDAIKGGSDHGSTWTTVTPVYCKP